MSDKYDQSGQELVPSVQWSFEGDHQTETAPKKKMNPYFITPSIIIIIIIIIMIIQFNGILVSKGDGQHKLKSYQQDRVWLRSPILEWQSR